MNLASILENKATCLKVYQDQLNEKIFFKFKTKEILIIENLDEKVDEKLLFSIWNMALQDNKYFLITSKKPINLLKFKLQD